MHARRRGGAALGALLVGVLLAAIFASTAQAAAYRYWTYWKVAGPSWEFAQAGPAGTTPADGSVEGWRFAVSATSGDQSNAPGIDPVAAFEEICATTAPVEGSKRVALVVDPGSAGDAPPGEAPGPVKTYCTVTPLDASGYDVLRSAGPVRVGEGLVCGIAGYPARECAEVVDQTQAEPATDAPAVQAPAPQEQSSAVPVIIGVGTLGVLAILAWQLRRRRRR